MPQQLLPSLYCLESSIEAEDGLPGELKCIFRVGEVG